MTYRRFLTGMCIAGVVLVGHGCARKPQSGVARTQPQVQYDLAQTAGARIQTIGRIEPAVLFYGPMPTGVAVSRSGRIFVNFPRWGDPVAFTVAEIRNGRAMAYPNLQINQGRGPDSLISVQSVVIDPQDRLWILDTASINFGPVQPGAAKLLCVDLNTNQVVKKITFPDNVVLPTTYLNDVRFDLNRGKEGMAFITDSSGTGPNGIIVVDLATGSSWRKLHDHPSTKADENFVPTVEGEPLMVRLPGQQPGYLRIGADGIAVDPNAGVLYYCPLASRRLHSVSLSALADPNLPDEQVAQTIKDLGPRDFASDGLDCAADGTLYLTDYEHNAIRKRLADGRYQIVAQDPRMIWPDSISIAQDGWLYFTANQLNRQARFHEGQDRRQQPYVLFRTRITDAPGGAPAMSGAHRK
ncbi:L-dopachrome tautomerase-related protein [Fontivita pretiosa]|uniref:L-dopachrome tautomerase-related protein n=1 Tax=Fontivita pretiosa TaxID=2989684 RepID=UPI003D183D22